MGKDSDRASNPIVVRVPIVFYILVVINFFKRLNSNLQLYSTYLWK